MLIGPDNVKKTIPCPATSRRNGATTQNRRIASRIAPKVVVMGLLMLLPRRASTIPDGAATAHETAFHKQRRQRR